MKKDTNIAKFLIQNGEEQDSYLHLPLFPVNIRLFKENFKYRDIIKQIIVYMCKITTTEYADYGKLKGLSGANVGIPYDIVILVDKKYNNRVFINPKIIEYSEGNKIVKSNCGSLQLKKPIKVKRAKKILVTFFEFKQDAANYDTWSLTKTKEEFKGAIASTLQHEIDHNNGVLINSYQRIGN